VAATDFSYLVAQHRTAAQNRFRWFWQTDPGPALDQIDGLADLLAFGDVTAANDATADLKSAYRSIDEHLDEGINGTNRDLIDWTGDSAEKFATYLSQVQEAVGTYKDILHDYVQIQAGYAALVQGVIDDASAMLTKAISAQTDVSEATWEVILTAIAAVSAGIGAAVSGPVGWAIVTSAVAGTASEASVIISNSDPASTAQSLADGLQGLLNDVNDQLDRFDKAVIELRHYLDGNSPMPSVNPPLPGFITAPSFDPSLFHLSDEPPGIENGVTRGQLVREPPPDGVPQSSISTRLAGP
jgi:uncharacterized protein YukE